MLRYWYDQKCRRCGSCHHFTPEWGPLGGCTLCGYRFHAEQGMSEDCDDFITEEQWTASVRNPVQMLNNNRKR